jgi:hypothetical protein
MSPPQKKTINVRIRHFKILVFAPCSQIDHFSWACNCIFPCAQSPHHLVSNPCTLHRVPPQSEAWLLYWQHLTKFIILFCMVQKTRMYMQLCMLRGKKIIKSNSLKYYVYIYIIYLSDLMTHSPSLQEGIPHEIRGITVCSLKFLSNSTLNIISGQQRTSFYLRSYDSV